MSYINYVKSDTKSGEHVKITIEFCDKPYYSDIINTLEECLQWVKDDLYMEKYKKGIKES